MHKKYLIALALSTITSPVFAQNSVQFTGKIYDEGCTIKVNNAVDTIVNLGNYNKDRIPNKGDTTDYVPFSVSLTDCPAVSTISPQALIRFTGETEGSESFFKNEADAASAAKNVGVILKNDKNAIVIENEDNEPVDLPEEGGDLSLTYYAAMVNNGVGESVSGGDVSSVVTFNVSYQ